MPLQILNGAQVALEALRETDQEAFERLLALLLKSSVDKTSFKHDAIVQDSDVNYATTNVSVNRSAANVDLWPYQDQINIRYRRIGLPTIKTRFGGRIRADLPATKRELVSIYLTANGLHDRSDQIEDAVVSELGEVDFSVIPGQFLIYGDMTLDVKPFQRQLADVIVNTTVLGFRTVGDFEAREETLFSQMLSSNEETLPYPLESQYLSWGTPVKVGGYRYDNTSIIVTGFGEEGYYLGPVELIYTRYDFGWASVGTQYLVEGPSTPSIPQMLASISLQTGLPLSVADVVSQTYDPIPTGEVQTLTIFFTEDNLRYTGELTIDYKAV